jgi:hypothetical protein
MISTRRGGLVGLRRNTAASVRNAIGPSLPRMPKKFPLPALQILTLAVLFARNTLLFAEGMLPIFFFAKKRGKCRGQYRML